MIIKCTEKIFVNINIKIIIVQVSLKIKRYTYKKIAQNNKLYFNIIVTMWYKINTVN